MKPIFWAALIVIIVASLILNSKKQGRRQYNYKKRNFLLSRAEREFYELLLEAVGQEFYVFPQIHLSSLVDNRVVGQNWFGAFRHIDEKSVDFVLCDKISLSPQIAIELDDQSHERVDRKNRDAEVNRILEMAGIPLIRIDNNSRLSGAELARKIKGKEAHIC